MNSDIIDDECLKNLNEIIRHTNAQIVLTSTWKQFWQCDELKNHEYKSLLIEKLKQYNMEIYDFAPNLKMKRTQEVQQWLSEHDNIESFVVLDDWSFDFETEMKDNFVQTCWFDNGLEKHHVDKAIAILTK